jgi:hypothetical protein
LPCGVLKGDIGPRSAFDEQFRPPRRRGDKQIVEFDFEF